MATTSTRADVYYPVSDGKPMAETPIHREAMTDLIASLKDWFVDDPLAYVSGNEFIYFVEGQPKRNVSPDVWCVRGIDKTVVRHSYMTWLEGGKGPEFVVEMTSRSTRREDLGKKFRLYQDDLKVLEYFLFDPLLEYLNPHLQGHRLVDGEYRRIEPVNGRLPSEVLGLHLEADGPRVRLYDPMTGRLPTRLEQIEQKDAVIQEKDTMIQEKDAVIQEKDAAIQEKDTVIQEKDAALLGAETEIERLRREIEALRTGSQPKPKPKKRK